MHIVDASMNDGIVSGFRKEPLQPPLYCLHIEGLRFGLVGARGEQHAPESQSVVAGDLEQRAPLLRIGEIVAGASGIFGVEGERGGQDQETFGMRVTLEFDPERFANRRAPAVAADEI